MSQIESSSRNSASDTHLLSNQNGTTSSINPSGTEDNNPPVPIPTIPHGGVPKMNTYGAIKNKQLGRAPDFKSQKMTLEGLTSLHYNDVNQDQDEDAFRPEEFIFKRFQKNPSSPHHQQPQQSIANHI
jgi:hypothetical protein